MVVRIPARITKNKQLLTGVIRIKKIYMEERSVSTSWHVADCGKDEHSETLRIMFAGPIPTPIGGISIHISRLSSWLSAKAIKVDHVDEARHKKKGVYNIRSLRVLSYLRHLARCNLAHIHSDVHLFRILHILACRLFGLRVIVTIHAWQAGNLVTLINRIFLVLAHQVILVNEEINDSLKLRDYQVLPAFLPPTTCRNDLPEEITTFIRKARARGCSLLCANAYQIREYKGQDLYGLDLCVELMDQLACRSDVKSALVFVVCCDARSNQLYANAQERIKERGLESNFCLYNKSVDFITLMDQCDIVLRPTNTDGDALTIREALYFGLPVIASDVVQRPPGTILFRNRDTKELIRRTVDVLKGGACRTCPPTENDYNSYFHKYLNLYIEVLNS